MSFLLLRYDFLRRLYINPTGNYPTHVIFSKSYFSFAQITACGGVIKGVWGAAISQHSSKRRQIIYIFTGGICRHRNSNNLIRTTIFLSFGVYALGDSISNLSKKFLNVGRYLGDLYRARLTEPYASAISTYIYIFHISTISFGPSFSF